MKRAEIIETIIAFVILIGLFLMFASCTSTKKLLEKKTDTKTTSTEVGTVASTRPGDTLTITVPTYKFKDTTIYKRGKTTTIVQRYNKQGELNIDCISDEIDELKEYVKNAIEEKEETVKEKEVKRGFKDIFILYGILGIVVLMFANKLMNKIT